jgi:alpha-beta hydrolase superfamily lysophospholipase
MILPPNPPQRPHIFAAWLTGHLLPWLRFGKPVAQEKLSNDPEQASSIMDDTLRHTQISMHLATQLLAQGRWAIDHAREIDLPTLIMHGDCDELIDQSACEHLAVRIGQQADHVVWPQMRHALFDDVGRQRVVEKLISWLSLLGPVV